METAKLFQNGKSQAIRLPKAYRLRGTKVYLKRMGNALVLIPEYDSWQSLLESVDLFSEDFMAERLQPPPQAREAPFAGAISTEPEGRKQG
ncbi:MAG TPA: type II toxin-antitoxin system VapB family antitoxin [Chloroflexia bacterium]|nr:type II toxin-antitoxin system VapB family antitoxin [Chloroflexia bacterium]